MIVMTQDSITTTCFVLHMSSSGYSKSKDFLRFLCGIVILLWFYYSSFYAVGRCYRWRLCVYVPGYRHFQLFVKLLHLHSCIALLADGV